MVAEILAPSPELVEANRRLYELRERAQAGKGQSSLGRVFRPPTSSPTRTVSPLSEGRDGIADLPAHLGWGSTAVTQAIRATGRRQGKVHHPVQEVQAEPRPEVGAAKAGSARLWSDETGSVEARPTGSSYLARETVKLYPDIALAMLQKDQTAAGRLWLLLRHLDGEGRGWLAIDFVREKLTTKNSDLRLCCWRQLRNLIRQGGGVFWDRDQDRLWLKSAAKVAAALEVQRLTGRPVQLPVEILLGGIGQVRAHFYASFHSSRKSDNPISRTKLKEITGVPERSQQIYEQTAGVTNRRNIAIGRRYSTKEVQEQAWQHGRATFELKDQEGRQGPAGQSYVAWQLPNSYQGCHKLCPKGRQKKINHHLNSQIDLVHHGAQGNGLERDNSQHGVDRLFHRNSLEAGKAYNRDGQDDAYWQASASRILAKSLRLWQVIPGRKVR